MHGNDCGKKEFVMQAEEIMPEDCAKWLRFCTMTSHVPPRTGAFVKFAQMIAEAA